MMPVAEIFLSQSPDIAARTLGDDTIIMSTLDSTVFMLNSAGTVIWNAADGKRSLSEIVRDCLCAEFDIGEEEAFADAEEFVSQMAGHGILRISHAPISSGEAG